MTIKTPNEIHEAFKPARASCERTQYLIPPAA